MKRKLLLVCLIVGIVVLGAVSGVSAINTYVTGTIASGAQYDLWALDLIAGEQVTATLVCDFDGVSRPLDPVLSVFFPGSDTSDTIFADVYNDDGFGSDDDPNGVDCDAFDSSRVFFGAPVTGTYIFRADGFGSSTGPYILSIVTGGGNPLAADGRINPQPTAPIILYCNAGSTDFYSVTGTFVGSVADGGSASLAGASVGPIAGGRMEVSAGLPDGKIYLFDWDGCADGKGSGEAYTIDSDGIPVLFDTVNYG
jgi:hypothetical protein